MMSKFTPVTPIFASLDSGEEHKYSFAIQVYTYSDISKIERVQRMSTSAISLEQFFSSPPSDYISVVLKKIEQEYYERITFIPYDINMGFMSSPVTDDFLSIINSFIGGQTFNDLTA